MPELALAVRPMLVPGGRIEPAAAAAAKVTHESSNRAAPAALAASERVCHGWRRGPCLRFRLSAAREALPAGLDDYDELPLADAALMAAPQFHVDRRLMHPRLFRRTVLCKRYLQCMRCISVS